ncbi:hypothetical protein BDZ88DRAFT_407459 [Geranomyces variabilis]|nr:hypothetical protein BDZ88DRAFT_407459 [Geranomyces variabilis]
MVLVRASVCAHPRSSSREGTVLAKNGAESTCATASQWNSKDSRARSCCSIVSGESRWKCSTPLFDHEAPSAPSLLITSNTLLAVMKRATGLSVSDEVRTSLRHFITSTLTTPDTVTNRPMLSLVRRVKPTLMSTDVDILVATVLKPRVVAKLHGGREILFLLAFKSLKVDCGARAGDISPQNAGHRERGEYLKWNDVQSTLLPPRQYGEHALLAATITFRWRKGKRLNSSDNTVIPLRILPTEKVFRDPVRLLVLMALAEGHFGKGVTASEQRNGHPLGV